MSQDNLGEEPLVPTMELRFLYGKLQQKFESLEGKDPVWRDVPHVIHTQDGNVN